MVNIELKTLMLQIIAVVIVLMAWRCDVVKTVWQENRTFIAEQKMLAQTTLTATEVDDFIRLWHVN